VSERTLTRRELNRALLARQLLLERARTRLPRALERVGGLQVQLDPFGRLDRSTRRELREEADRLSAFHA
jgi:hypothetical protein